MMLMKCGRKVSLGHWHWANHYCHSRTAFYSRVYQLHWAVPGVVGGLESRIEELRRSLLFKVHFAVAVLETSHQTVTELPKTYPRFS